LKDRAIESTESEKQKRNQMKERDQRQRDHSSGLVNALWKSKKEKRERDRKAFEEIRKMF
jgi:hypothetical protein